MRVRLCGYAVEADVDFPRSSSDKMVISVARMRVKAWICSASSGVRDSMICAMVAMSEVSEERLVEYLGPLVRRCESVVGEEGGFSSAEAERACASGEVPDVGDGWAEMDSSWRSFSSRSFFRR